MYKLARVNFINLFMLYPSSYTLRQTFTLKKVSQKFRAEHKMPLRPNLAYKKSTSVRKRHLGLKLDAMPFRALCCAFEKLFGKVMHWMVTVLVTVL